MQTERGSVASLFSCARAPRVKSCRGTLTHTLRPWALSLTHTMGLRRLGSGLGPQALSSHTLNQCLIPAWDSDSVPVTVLRVAGRSPALLTSLSLHEPSADPFLKYEDPWRYLISCRTLTDSQKSGVSLTHFCVTLTLTLRHFFELGYKLRENFSCCVDFYFGRCASFVWKILP